MLQKCQLNLSVLAMSFVLIAGLAACSTADSSKADSASSSNRATQGKANQKQAASSVRQAQMQTQSQSSLDALRRGESTATASNSALKEIYFDFDQYNLSSDARATLKKSGRLAEKQSVGAS